MNILGLSAFYHDSAACLLQDGRLVAAAQEERFTRKRHDPDFPHHAIDFCLKTAGIQTKDLHYVSFYEKPFIKFERILESLIAEAPRSYSLALAALPIWLKKKLWMRKLIWQQLGANIPVIFPAHHEAHAASAFFPSPFQEAATLTTDGVGEWSTTTWGIGKHNRLELREEIRYPHSLGLFYSAFTQYLGFRVNSAEYKVMGLAPYGEPKYVQQIKDHLIEVFPNGSFILNLDYFSYPRKKKMINSRFEKLFDRPRRKPESTLEVFHADVARSLQVVTEEIMLKLTAHVHKMTSLKNLCLAGGVALNCVANGRILKEGPFENLWIQPAAGDSGGAVGAAYIAWHHVEGKERLSRLGDAQLGSFLGPEFGDPEIEDSFRKFGIAFKKWSKQELLEKTASILSEQKIVGWFQGKMEFGPRALGARSILGDPRNPEMQKRMNLKIKFRESFRPFAPSVLIEDTKQYFNLEAESPYMLLTCAAKEEVTSVRAAVGSNWISERLGSVQGRLPAVTHVDGSARVHTVERLRNPIFYELLKTFRNKTGCPVLINTSFNVRGEPIVCTPEDAIVCFLRTEIDVLVIGSYIAERSVQDPAIIDAIRKQAKNYEPD